MGDKQSLDYTMVCRTCLQSNVEMINLSALIENNLIKEEIPKTYMECLEICIQPEEIPDLQMPERICVGCASALQVSYWFITNARQAQDMLKLKLMEIKRKKLGEKEASADVKRNKRYRCKICNVRVETKRNLKEHVKLHLDIIVYSCQLCSFESHNRSTLSDHYTQIHAIEATREQLKPKTKLSPLPSPSFTNNDRMEGAMKSEHFQLLPEDSPHISYQEPATNSMSDMESLQESTIMSTTNSNYNTIFNTISDTTNNDLDVANEFMVMSDGSIEKVINEGVVIEYIDAQSDSATLTLDNGLMLDNIIQVQNVNDTLMLEQDNEIGQMDVDDLIIEDPGEIIEVAPVQNNILLPLEEEAIPVSIIEQPKKIMCKICTKDFLTQEELKNHMLNHNEIPHFFCDQCKFYTFFKIDLHQHYKSKHNIHPTNKQLQPKNKQRNICEYFACDLCFYEAETKIDIKRHYKTKHNIEANEIHLKPTKSEKTITKFSPLTAKAKAAALVSRPTITENKNPKYQSVEGVTPDYINGLNCRKCQKVFYWRKELYEHYKMHSAEEAAQKQAKQATKFQNKPTSLNLNVNKTKNTKTATQLVKATQIKLETTNTLTDSSLVTLGLNVSSSPNISSLNSVAPLTPSSSSTFTLPSDAIPQIVETDQTIENDLTFGFRCEDDVLFGDFDDDVDVENNSDENDSDLRNILLTSDDDFEDMLQDQDNVNNTPTSLDSNGSFCAHCQKTFLSQYQYENHMFIHRGLAPYRCELCTNLYNTKRCLIRHYRAVHKNIPSRDMIQAKGDKVCDEKTAAEHLELEPSTCYMCAKCPYESSDLSNIVYHLKSSHSINDESFIIKKLPFECPRCIRSFATKLLLLRHLERNHSTTPINQHQNFFDNTKVSSAVTASTSLTSITTTINNHVNMTNTESIETNASCGKINKVNTSASSTTKYLTNNPIPTANVNYYYNNSNNKTKYSS